MCSLASNCHENIKVKGLLTNFWSGSISDLRSYREFKRGPQKRLWRNLVFAYEGLNSANSLRIELLCGSFSRWFIELSEDLIAEE